MIKNLSLYLRKVSIDLFLIFFPFHYILIDFVTMFFVAFFEKCLFLNVVQLFFAVDGNKESNNKRRKML